MIAIQIILNSVGGTNQSMIKLVRDHGPQHINLKDFVDFFFNDFLNDPLQSVIMLRNS